MLGRCGRAKGWKMNIAVLDDGGGLLYFRRDPASFRGSVEISINKAWTATQFGFPTRPLGEPSHGSGGVERRDLRERAGTHDEDVVGIPGLEISVDDALGRVAPRHGAADLVDDPVRHARVEVLADVPDRRSHQRRGSHLLRQGDDGAKRCSVRSLRRAATRSPQTIPGASSADRLVALQLRTRPGVARVGRPSEITACPFTNTCSI